MDKEECSNIVIDLKRESYQKKEIEIVSTVKAHLDSLIKLEGNQLKKHGFPLTRIKKIVKSDEEVKLISCDYSPLMGKCCEYFIEELVHCSWAHTEEERRVTLQKSDILTYINRSEVHDFLAAILRNDST